MAQTYITGLSLIDSADLSYATSSQVVPPGKIYSADSTASPAPLAAVDMGHAYDDASTANPADYSEAYGGALDDKVLYPGL